jgi:mono/diheme cytochrome c family protein
MWTGVDAMTLLAQACRSRRAFWFSFAAVLVPSAPLIADQSKISYDRDIRPILADNCFACHGPDAKQRKAKLRLDTRSGALAELRSGGHAIVPGKADESVLIERISSDDPSQQMPPKKSGKHLTAAQTELLRRWIADGASYTVHWAFVPPMRHALPKVHSRAETRNGAGAGNAIDAFIFARLEREGLQPSPQADQVTLIRRVTLDLTGLPPTPAEVDAFLADTSPNAYEQLVDRLLRSPRYGEHMARFWLDAARYGDTHGLHLDNYREMWPYRDWVIKALNDNKPYDRFLIEQLAGDLLPKPTLDQIVATGFNRCHVSTSEGGSIEEEVYVRNVIDRVDTTGTVFLGLTVGCARCHDHKFDPIKTKEFYQFFAFFNSMDGPALDGNAARPAPTVSVPSAEQTAQLERLRQAVASIREQIDDETAQAWHTKEYTRIAPLCRQIAALDKQRQHIEKDIPATLVFKERATPRKAYVLKRGEYDQRSEQVGRDTPRFLPPLPEKAPRNRLGLAQWMLSPDHPLTARVEVNRLWQQCFGTGLVKTSEDFGTQGESPSHPELLDWLAVQFRDDGWNIKAMMKRIVMSATYRQSSRVSKDRLMKDADNRLLSRGPRFRLDAEMLRDQALFVSGLLVEKLGGPSVKPPQPAGLWEAVGYTGSNTKNFVPDRGREKVHRRSMYTFWKRTAPPPQMNTFDAPSRESCLVRRERTNTPLQALLLMNEPQFIEAARTLAERTMKQGGATLEARLVSMFRLTTARRPDAKELTVLTTSYQEHLATYRRDTAKAKQLISVGERKPDATLNASELAAWTMIANLLLNLDEVLSKG